MPHTIHTVTYESVLSLPRFKMPSLYKKIFSDGILVKDSSTGVLVRRIKVKDMYDKLLADHHDLNSKLQRIDCKTVETIQKLVTHRRNP
ncbi:hypothetical protein T4D_5581 [Trichinella pseudospiralis]|uniref:Uncharacterized protein n=1 Tax=Trichinella pseudospiralis TaxID=6337 RepID=A0A0V1FQX7_TRIPS|nr:hypothetical protein T4D_5581 [Trichinella pseudospiralis]